MCHPFLTTHRASFPPIHWLIFKRVYIFCHKIDFCCPTMLADNICLFFVYFVSSALGLWWQDLATLGSLFYFIDEICWKNFVRKFCVLNNKYCSTLLICFDPVATKLTTYFYTCRNTVFLSITCSFMCVTAPSISEAASQGRCREWRASGWRKDIEPATCRRQFESIYVWILC